MSDGCEVEVVVVGLDRAAAFSGSFGEGAAEAVEEAEEADDGFIGSFGMGRVAGALDGWVVVQLKVAGNSIFDQG